MKSGNTSSSTNATSSYKALSSQLSGLKTQLAGLKSQIKSSRPTPVPKKGKPPANEKEEGLRELYADYRDNVLADYVYGLYHPDVVFKESLDIKSPSYMPVPTTTFKFKETFTVTPNASGNFVLFWFPSFLGTSEALERRFNAEAGWHACYSNVYVNTSAALTGNNPLNTNWLGMLFKPVLQDFQKYRLTSACIKVKYTGKVFDQSGMLAACASYLQSPRCVCLVDHDLPGSFPIPSAWCNGIAKFGDFDTIRQGQWAETTSLVTDPDGITCTWVPTDPLNQVFVDNGMTIDVAASQSVPWDDNVKYECWNPSNADISYAIAGYGIANQTSCITVECYYNYEIIVKQEQYPYFSPRVANTKLLNHKESLHRVTDMITGSGLVVKSKTHENIGTWSKVRNAFTTAGRVFTDVYPYIKPLIKLLV